jgi:tRNA(fMet)-specific endonuclease VapC
MRYLLDTNIVSDLIRNPRGSMASRIQEVGESQVATSIIVAAELRYGAAKKGSARLTAQVEAVLGAMRSWLSKNQPTACMEYSALSRKPKGRCLAAMTC